MDSIVIVFSAIVAISVFFSVLLHQNIYYSLIFLLPAIFTLFIFGVEWLSGNYTVLSILIFIIILSFLTVAIVFARKYMEFHYSDEIAGGKKEKE